MMSIFCSMHYLVSQDDRWLWYAMMLVPLGLLFDILDGRIARWRQASSLLGQELDSLADLISFGIAPAVCGFDVGMRTFLDVAVMSMFVACGIARLARYNATVALMPKDAAGKIKYFEGTPIPTTLVIMCVIAYNVHKGNVGDELPLGEVNLCEGIAFHPLVLLYALSGTAMVSKTLKIPKI